MDNKKKTQVDFIQSHSLRDILLTLNKYNEDYPDAPILKEDIVTIFKEEDTFILVYYK